MSEQDELRNHEHEDIIQRDEIGEEVPDDAGNPDRMSEDEQDDGPDEDQVEPGDQDDEHQGHGDDRVEIDLSNNSQAYFDTHTDAVYLIASHPTLPLVVTGGGDNVGYLWTTNRNPPVLVTKLSGHTESVVAGGFTFDGSFVVTGDMNGQIRVWRALSRGQRWDFYGSVQELNEVVWITFHPKQQIFAAGAQDGSVWVYALEPKLELISVLKYHSMTTNAGVFVNTDDLDTLTLVTVSEDTSLVCWDAYLSTAKYTLGTKEFKGEHPWVSLALSPTGRTVAVGSADGLVAIVGIENGKVLQAFSPPTGDIDLLEKSIESLVWSDKAKLLAAGNVAGKVFLYDITVWQLRRTLEVEDAVTKLVFVPNTAKLYVSSMDGQITRHDALSGALEWTALGHAEGVLGFVVQNDGKRVISAGDDNVSLVFDVE